MKARQEVDQHLDEAERRTMAENIARGHMERDELNRRLVDEIDKVRAEGDVADAMWKSLIEDSKWELDETKNINTKTFGCSKTDCPR